MDRPLKLWVGVATTGLIVALTTSACATSGAAEAAGAAGAATACSAPGVTPKELKIGLVFPNTGILATVFRSVRSGVEARIGVANATGGIRGRQISIEWRDDESDATKNLTASRDLIENVGVFGILQETSFVSGSAEYLSTKGVPVTGLVTDSTWGKYSNMFTASNQYADGSNVSTFGLYAKQNGGTRAYLLESTLRASSRMAAAKLEASLKSQGIRIVGTGDYSENSTDPAHVAADIRRSGADVIVGAISGTGLANVVKAARAAGVPIKAAFGPDGYYPSLLPQFGPSIAGMAVYIGFTPFEAHSAALDAYRNAMVQYAPELNPPDQGTAVMGYITADLFLRGLAAAGDCPTRSGFIQSLRAVHNYNADGLLAETVDMATSSIQVSRCYFFVRVNDAATAFEVVPGGRGPDGKQWCGEPIAAE
ncbi:MULTISPECIES: ABC transporter substrate-binding protein [unclassified Frankia]|uniref:ABC transporter substrate-binding protein n=1 Tax=unclassified Frankia TaxID=2632575 RepID=UPI002AD452E7|nr:MULTISPECIES: ABC transporter substrate-binding protein [unclassified Frankia]